MIIGCEVSTSFSWNWYLWMWNMCIMCHVQILQEIVTPQRKSQCFSCFIESQENQVGEVSNITKFTQIYVYIVVNHSNLSQGHTKCWWLYGNPPENAWNSPEKNKWRFKALETWVYSFYITSKNEGNVGSKKYRSKTIDATVHVHYILKLGTLLPTSPWKIPVVFLQKLRHVTACFCCPLITWKDSSMDFLRT